jgi:hypothetical protein
VSNQFPSERLSTLKRSVYNLIKHFYTFHTWTSHVFFELKNSVKNAASSGCTDAKRLLLF